jgi:hypothetical protein
MPLSDPAREVPMPHDASPEPPRVRLVDVRVQRTPYGRQRVEVDLEAPDGRRVTGMHEEMLSGNADVRIAAQATLAALRAALPAAPTFIVAGAKTVRAFDQTVTLVLIGIEGRAGPARLLGAAANEEFIPRAAVIAVLNATNRVRAPAVEA